MTSAQACVALLKEAGANSVFHHGQTLFEHLCGTFAILEQWNSQEHVRVAGLLHSIYGWLAEATPHSRKIFTEFVGQSAEELIYAYSIIPPSHLIQPIARRKIHDPQVALWTSTGDRIAFNRETYMNLILLDLANCADIVLNGSLLPRQVTLLFNHVKVALSIQSEAVARTFQSIASLKLH